MVNSLTDSQKAVLWMRTQLCPPTEIVELYAMDDNGTVAFSTDKRDIHTRPESNVRIFDREQKHLATFIIPRF